MWSVSLAKAHLSEVLRLARSGQPQTIGSQNPCVVVPLSDYQKLLDSVDHTHDGLWLVNAASKVGYDIELPSRSEDRQDIIFED